MAAASATGEMFVTGKSKKPRCFKNVKQFPCRYRAQKKSWKTGVLFKEWVRKLKSSFRGQSRNAALLIENCLCHPEIKNLANINLIFLPPNTTSVLQSIDQGVIRSLKAHNRKKVVRLCIKAVESRKLVHSKACMGISRNCMSSIIMSFSKIYQINHILISKSYPDLDMEVVTSASFSNDDDTIAEVIEGANEESEDDQDDEANTPSTRLSTNEVEDTLGRLQDLSMFSTRGDEIHSLVSLLVRERIDNLKQSAGNDFFKTK